MKAHQINACGGSPLASFKHYLQSQGKSKSTVERYHSFALDFLAWLDADGTEVQNATAKEVLAYLQHLQKRGYQNPTRNLRLLVIKQFFNYQIEAGQRSDNPVAHLKIRGSKQQKLYPILSKTELEAIYQNYQVPEENDPRSKRNWFLSYRQSKARNKTILSLLIHQGITTTEISRLTTTDLRLRAGTIDIASSRKSNERTLELKSHQIMELMEYTYQLRPNLLAYQADKTIPQLFLSAPSAGKKQTTSTELSIFKKLSQDIKAQHPQFINLQQVRTSVITHWLKQHNLRKVQYMAGHRYVSSTEAYLVNQVEELQNAIEQYHPLA